MFYYWILWQEEIHCNINNDPDHETINEHTYNFCFIASRKKTNKNS